MPKNFFDTEGVKEAVFFFFVCVSNYLEFTLNDLLFFSTNVFNLQVWPKLNMFLVIVSLFDQ